MASVGTDTGLVSHTAFFAAGFGAGSRSRQFVAHGVFALFAF